MVNFKKLLFFFALILGLLPMGVSAETLTEDFESVSLTDADGNPLASSWAYGYGLSNGWKIIGGSIYASAGTTNYGLVSSNGHESNRCLEASYGASNSAFVAIPTKLMGTMSFYAAGAASSVDGTIKVYEITEADGSYIKGEVLETFTPTKYNSSSRTYVWNEFTVDLGTEGKLVGIEMVRSRLDDFSAEVWEQGEEVVKSLKLNSITPENATVLVDETGNWTNMFTVSVTNNGTADITADDNAEVTLKDADETTSIAMPVSVLAAGETTDVVFVLSGLAGEYEGPVTVNATENITNTTASVTFNVELPKPVFGIDVNATNGIDYGFNAQQAEVAAQTATISNTGTGDLNVTAFTMPEGFTVSEAEFTVAAGETKTVELGISTESTGIKTGNATIEYNGGTFTFPLNGYVYPADAEYSDLTSLPEGWENDKYQIDGVANVGYEEAKLTSPAIKFVDGNKFAIKAKLNSSMGEVTVKGSADGGQTYTNIATLNDNVFNTSTFATAEVEVAENINKLQIVGYQVQIDDIAGWTINNEAPLMKVTLNDETPANDDFGKLTESATHTYKIENAGTGSLYAIVGIEDDEQGMFSIDATEYTLAAGESADVNVTFNYAEGNYGTFAATLTFLSDDSEVNVNLSATAKDPNIWEEDFEAGELPEGWELVSPEDAGTSSANWRIDTFSGYENTSVMALAPQYSTAASIVTPRLQAKADETLTWDAYLNWYDEPLKVEYSADDKQTWTEIYNYQSQDEEISSRYYHKEMSFTAPADGYYYLRFTSTYSNGIDNFLGFKYAPKEHEVIMTANNIPATATIGAEYTATATVKEMVGKDENATATLYIDGEAVATATDAIAAGAEQTFALSFVPTQLYEAAEAYIEVVVADTEIALETEKVELNVTAQNINLSEDVTYGDTEGLYQVTLDYRFVEGYNTIVLPFDVDDLSAFADVYEGMQVYEFEAVDADTKTVSFKKAETIAAGVPYIVYTETATTQSVDEEGDPLYGYQDAYIFPLVTLNPEKSWEAGETQFVGNYTQRKDISDAFAINAEDGQLKNGSEAGILKVFHAYVVLDAEDASEYTVKFEGQEEPDGINAVEFFNQLDGNIYDLNGRKMNKTNGLRPGIYVNNGKKFVVK